MSENKNIEQLEQEQQLKNLGFYVESNTSGQGCIIKKKLHRINTGMLLEGN